MLVVVIALSSLGACFEAGLGEPEPGGGGGSSSVSLSDIVALFVEAQEETDLSYDFGPVDPNGPGTTVAVSIENTSGEARTIDAVSSDDPAFTLDLPPLPLTLDPGASADFSLTFAPPGSGPESGAVTASLAGLAEELTLAVTGEGNEPPAALAIITVSGAGRAAVNGTYYRDGTYNQYDGPGAGTGLNYPVPRYVHPGGVYHIFGQTYTYNFGQGGYDVLLWLLDDDYFDFDTDSEYLYSAGGEHAYIPPSLPGDGVWDPLSQNDAPTPTVTSELGSTVSDSLAVYPQPSPQLEAYYEYTDGEDDPEGTSLFQWFRGAEPTTPSSSRVAIAGASSQTYTITSADEGFHLWVRVTPVASSGTEEGAPLWLGPSAPVTIE